MMTDQSMHVHTVAAPVRQKVFEVLREAITTGRFKPGQRLIEKDLCDLMGVSRPSVREALRHLESEGLIETIPNRGPIVTVVTEQDAVSIYQVRASLEALAAELFAVNAGDDEITELKSAFTQLNAAIDSKHLPAIIECKDAFYRCLFKGSRNVTIATILRTINARVTFLRRISLSSPERAPVTRAELQAVIDAIVRRDARAAHDAMAHHVEEAAKVALENLRAQAEG